MNARLALGLACMMAIPSLTLAQTPTWTYDPDSGKYPNEEGQPFASPGYQAGADIYRNLVDLGGGDMVLEINTIGTNAGLYYGMDAPAPNWNVNLNTGYSTEWRLRMDPTELTYPTAAGLVAGNDTAYSFMRVYDVFGYLIVEIQGSDANPGGVTHALGNPKGWHTYRMDVQNIAGQPTATLYVDNYHSPVATKILPPGAANSMWFGDGTAGDGKYQVDYVKSWQSGPVGAPAVPNAALLSHTLLSASYDGNTGNVGLDADFARGGNTAVGTGGILVSPGKFGAGAMDPITASGTVNYPSAGNFNVNAGTVEMWVKTSNWSNGDYYGFFDIYGTGESDIRLQKTNGDKLQAVVADIADPDSNNWKVWSITSDALTLDDGWHHVAWSWDHNVGMSFLYLDGQVIADIFDMSVTNLQAPGFDGTLASTIEVGSVQNGSVPFNGLIDEFRISALDIYQGASFTPPAQAYALSQWAVDAAGNWSDGANWSGGLAPNWVGAAANFADAITSPRTVTLDAAQTVGLMTFDSTASYTVAGTGTLTIDVGGGSGSIKVLNGSHSIAAPIVLADDTTVDVAAGQTLSVQHLRGAGVTVNTGTLKMIAGASANSADGASKLTAVTVASGAVLDLTNNSLVIDYTGTSVQEDVRQALADGRLTSSSADANKKLGYGEASATGFANGTFAGQSVDADAVLVKFTYGGDSNLDGKVDVGDLGNLASNWQQSAPWTGGDFDYNGTVNVGDLGILATNWQQGVTTPTLGPSFQEALAALGLPNVSVPEPSALGLAGIGLLAALGHRRRNTRI